ncbi:transcriptional regulator [Pandoraea sputorum]|uniref:transcriptional regulator n=1 Tax=Pandoraea sputorum TaxID=93222 RepID=UPI0012416765|nr:YdaS family helix-turn-helix protein [Pandoraea sputorum]
MDLKSYLSAERGRLSRLSRSIGAHPSDVSAWASGKRPVPIPFAWPIERDTGGAVTRPELRKDDWQSIWPELMSDKSRHRSSADAARDSAGAEIDGFGAALPVGGAR